MELRVNLMLEDFLSPNRIWKTHKNRQLYLQPGFTLTSINRHFSYSAVSWIELLFICHLRHDRPEKSCPFETFTRKNYQRWRLVTYVSNLKLTSRSCKLSPDYFYVSDTTEVTEVGSFYSDLPFYLEKDFEVCPFFNGFKNSLLIIKVLPQPNPYTLRFPLVILFIAPLTLRVQWN